MKKYKYVYQIRTNNLCYGALLLDTCKTYKQALYKLYNYQNKYGACDIYKKDNIFNYNLKRGLKQMDNDNNKNNIQPDYSSCSLYEYFKVLETQETEKRVIESLKKFNGYVSKLLDDDTNN